MADEIAKDEVLEEEVPEEVEPTEVEDETEEQPEQDIESEEEEPEQPEFQKRFTQLKGDTPDEYIKNLEAAYAESGKEAVKLAREVRELKTPDKEETKPVETNPAILWAQSQMQQTWQKEWDTFTEDHPEINEKDSSYDAKLADDLNEQLVIVRDVILKKEGRQVGMAEGLTKAWRLLDMEDNSKERVAMAAKDVAGQGKASSSKTKEAKPKFSDSQIAVAMDMMNVDRQEAIKRMSAYN